MLCLPSPKDTDYCRNDNKDTSTRINTRPPPSHTSTGDAITTKKRSTPLGTIERHCERALNTVENIFSLFFPFHPENRSGIKTGRFRISISGTVPGFFPIPSPPHPPYPPGASEFPVRMKRADPEENFREKGKGRKKRE